MEYTYELDEDNNVKIYWGSQKCEQNNNPETLMPFTTEDANAWAIAAIEKLKNNNHIYASSLFLKNISTESNS